MAFPLAFAPAGLALSAWIATAGATVPEKYGTGAASMGVAGAGVASVDDGHAALINPAGLSRMRRPAAGVGFSAAWDRFEPIPSVWWDTNRDGAVDARDPPLDVPSDLEDALGVHFFMGRHIGGKFGLGIVGYVPTRRVLELRTIEPSIPEWFLYGSRVQRYVLAAGVGGQILPGVHVGGGVDFVPRVRVSFAATVDGSIRGDADGDGLADAFSDVVVDVHEMDLEIIATFAPTLGLQLELGAWSEALEGLSVGLSWHGALGLPVQSEVDAQVNLGVEEVGDLDPFLLAVVAAAGVDLFDHYVPMTLTGGLAWRRPHRPGFTVDLKWTDWRPMLLSVARLGETEIDSPLIRLDDQIVDGNAVEASFRATVAVRGGIEVPLPRIEAGERFRYVDLVLRAGGGFEPTPLVSQGAESALLDAGRGLISAGLGVETWDPVDLVDGPTWLDLAAQLHLLSPGTLARATDTPRAGYPVATDAIPLGGHLWVVSAQWGFQF